MENLMSWITGFIIWFFLIVLLAILTFLITSRKTGYFKKGEIPDKAFEYYYRPDFIPSDAFLLDTHSHTIASDGRMTLEQNIKWHIANGFNAFVVTDHNESVDKEEFLRLKEKYKSKIIMIPGYEWTTPRIHINILGVFSFQRPSESNPSDEEIKQVIKKGHEMGGIVQVDHITWTLDRPEQRSGKYVHPTRDQLYEWGIDGYEINNEMRWYDPKTVHWLENKKKEGTLDRPIYLCTGTDIHNPITEFATGWTEVLLTEEEKKNPSEEIILNALKEGRTRIWVDHDYREPPERKILGISEQKTPFYKKFFAPFYGLAYGIDHVPGGTAGVISYVLWFLFAYFPLRAIFEWWILKH